MKKLLSILLAGCMLFSLFSITSAAVKVTENRNMSVVIDGKFQSFKSVPILVNSQVLLPFSELAGKLGLKSSRANNNLSISGANVSISMQISSTKAVVNKKAVSTGCAPIIYKNTVYVPAKFISDNTARKYKWDASTSTAYIMKADNYNKVALLSSKSEAADKAIKKVKCVYSYNMVIYGEKYIRTGIREIDNVKKIEHTIEKEDNEQEETYFINNASYTKGTNGKWVKKALKPEEFKSEFDSVSDDDMDDFYNYSLIITNKGNTADELVLEGDINSSDFRKEIGDPNLKLHIKLVLNKSDYSTKALTMTASGTISNPKAQFTLSIIVNAEKLDDSYEIKMPADLKL